MNAEPSQARPVINVRFSPKMSFEATPVALHSSQTFDHVMCAELGGIMHPNAWRARAVCSKIGWFVSVEIAR
ncbi:hypothetical protein GCM10011326_48170 [Salipiger profundus]|jgi:hypothetical protein|nr:hypothetical protein GCM10011326_48170 [Salipiger profundus]